MSDAPQIDPRLVDLLYGELTESEEAALHQEMRENAVLAKAWSELQTIETGLGKPAATEAPARVRQNVLREARLKLDSGERTAPWWTAVWLPAGVMAAAAAVGLALLLPSLQDRHADTTSVSPAPVAVEAGEQPEPAEVTMEQSHQPSGLDEEEEEPEPLMAIAVEESDLSEELVETGSTPPPARLSPVARQARRAADDRPAQPQPDDAGQETQGWAPIGSAGNQGAIGSGALDRERVEGVAGGAARGRGSGPVAAAPPPQQEPAETVAEAAPAEPTPEPLSATAAPGRAESTTTFRDTFVDDIAEEASGAPMRRETRSRTSAPAQAEEQTRSAPATSSARPPARSTTAAPEAEGLEEPTHDERLIRRIERLDLHDPRRPVLMLEVAERAHGRGDDATARIWWQRIVREHPEEPAAENARQRLAR